MKWTLFDRLAQRWLETSIAKRFFSGKVKRILSVLYPSRNPEEVCRSYYREKTVLVLRIGVVAGVFIVLVIISEHSSSLWKTGNVLMRGEESQQIELKVQTNESDETRIMYELRPKQYTKAQIREFVENFRAQGESLILGENEELMQIRSDLCLEETYPDYPMQFSWESSDYARIAEDGSVENEELKSPQTVRLTAEIRYEDQVYKQDFTVCVVPKLRTEAERREEEVLSALQKEDEEQKYSEKFQLPEKMFGEKAEYEIPKNATPIWMLALLPVVLVAVYSAKDRDLEKELERRKRRLSLRYPEFVSKIQLLLGAGVSVRNVFIRLSEDVSLGEELQGELEIVVRDLKNGMPLRDALDRFGKRTANPLYIKFCALMQQNMKKGTEDILVQLSGEVSEAFSLRKMQARQLGEEVGTKLLIPMILMLAVVMAALMIPAFLSFQL